jgi:hypothetical protein
MPVSSISALGCRYRNRLLVDQQVGENCAGASLSPPPSFPLLLFLLLSLLLHHHFFSSAVIQQQWSATGCKDLLNVHLCFWATWQIQIQVPNINWRVEITVTLRQCSTSRLHTQPLGSELSHTVHGRTARWAHITASHPRLILSKWSTIVCSCSPSVISHSSCLFSVLLHDCHHVNLVLLPEAVSD